MDVTGLSLMNHLPRRQINIAEFNWKARNFWVQCSPLFFLVWALAVVPLSAEPISRANPSLLTPWPQQLWC